MTQPDQFQDFLQDVEGRAGWAAGHEATVDQGVDRGYAPLIRLTVLADVNGAVAPAVSIRNGYTPAEAALLLQDAAALLLQHVKPTPEEMAAWELAKAQAKVNWEAQR